jgi:hypothetical protein
MRFIMQHENANPSLPPAASPADRRAWPRFPAQPETWGEVFDPETFIFQTALVLDLSAGGFGLLMPEPVPRETALWVEVQQRGRFRNLPAHVRHVRKSGGAWLHGCALDVPLTPAEMRELLTSAPAPRNN